MTGYHPATVAELVPYPFARLLTRALSQIETEQSIFHLPQKKMVRGLPGKDLSVNFHGHTASSPLGPAAGPHSQLAQNIVLSFLGGGRIFELTAFGEQGLVEQRAGLGRDLGAAGLELAAGPAAQRGGSFAVAGWCRDCQPFQ